jgi:large subunit ribosomal protein L19
MKIIDKIEGEQLKEKAPDFKVGDSVKVATRVREGEKERTQTFSGVVIARNGRGINATFTVRRISHGEGVERVFPLHSPFLESIKVESSAFVRRSKLYYLRDRKGNMTLRPAKTQFTSKAKKKRTVKKVATKKAARKKVAAKKAAARKKK